MAHVPYRLWGDRKMSIVMSRQALDGSPADKRRSIEREGEQLDNDAGRAFRQYLAARRDGLPACEIAALKATYEAAASLYRLFPTRRP
jgi:hypothetical protein